MTKRHESPCFHSSYIFPFIISFIFSYFRFLYSTLGFLFGSENLIFLLLNPLSLCMVDRKGYGVSSISSIKYVIAQMLLLRLYILNFVSRLVFLINVLNFPYKCIYIPDLTFEILSFLVWSQFIWLNRLQWSVLKRDTVFVFDTFITPVKHLWSIKTKCSLFSKNINFFLRQCFSFYVLFSVAKLSVANWRLLTIIRAGHTHARTIALTIC